MLLTLFWVYSLHASTACFCLNRHYGCFYPDSWMAKSIQNSRTPQKISITGSMKTTQEGILYVPNYTNYTHWPIIISAEKVEFMTLDPYGSTGSTVVSPSLRSSHAHPPTCPVTSQSTLDRSGVCLMCWEVKKWGCIKTNLAIFGGMIIHLPVIWGSLGYQGFDSYPNVKRCEMWKDLKMKLRNTHL
jgi:hypothetical protein